MNIKEPEKQILDDFEHRVTRRISMYGERSDFPQMANYGLDRQQLDDYLFDKQAILDSEGSERSQLTVGGIITVLPVIVLSALPDSSVVYAHGKMWATVGAIVLGLLVALFVKSIMRMIVYYRLSKHKNPKIETYIKAVLFYEA